MGEKVKREFYIAMNEDGLVGVGLDVVEALDSLECETPSRMAGIRVVRASVSMSPPEVIDAGVIDVPDGGVATEIFPSVGYWNKPTYPAGYEGVKVPWHGGGGDQGRPSEEEIKSGWMAAKGSGGGSDPNLPNPYGLRENDCIIAVTEDLNSYILARSPHHKQRNTLLYPTPAANNFTPENWDSDLEPGVFRVTLNPWAEFNAETPNRSGFDAIWIQTLYLLKDLKS